MPRFPHTKLFHGPRLTVVLSGPHIQVLDEHGHILHSTTNFAQEDKNTLADSGPIRCSSMSNDGRYLATIGDDKRLNVWDIETLTLLSTCELPKKPTSIEFSTGVMDLLVADKFGDVFRYALHSSNVEPIVEKTYSDASSGELMLGHASLLTGCLLTPDEKYIITADRDEHIRVSWYPEGYVIESYCLGHKKYVSAIHIPTACPAILISGGGDSQLKVWEWMTGHLQQNITVFPTVKSFISLAVQNRRRESEPEDPEKSLGESSAKSDVAFVIRRISSFVSDDAIHVVFSAVGATAIFEFVLTETPNQPDIRHYDFKRPVIDFTVGRDGMIWALLDADFPGEFNTHNETRQLVQVVNWSVDKFVHAGDSKLLDSLNTMCSLPATAEDLQSLDLYSDLSFLPKFTVREQDSLEGMSHELPENQPTGEGTLGSAGLTKRALGRLKHKRALDQLHGMQRGNEAKHATEPKCQAQR